MSYSRWSNSTWYTFWTSFSEQTQYRFPTQQLKNNQVFEICDSPFLHFTYLEICEDLEKVLNLVRETYSKPYEGNMLVEWKGPDSKPVYESHIFDPKNPSEDEILELKLYMLEFKVDIDRHFEPFTFFLYEWYYPTRNAIYFKWRDLLAFFRGVFHTHDRADNGKGIR